MRLSLPAISTASTLSQRPGVGLPLDQMRSRLVREIEKERESSARDPVLAQALKLAMAALLRPSPEATFCSTGSPIFCPPRLTGSGSPGLRTLEEKDQIVKLLDRTLNAPASVSSSVRGQPGGLDRSFGGGRQLRGEDRPLGTIGVIGPSRMSYSKVIPLVDFTLM